VRERVIKQLPSLNHFTVTWHDSVTLEIKVAHCFEMVLLNYSPVRCAECESRTPCVIVWTYTSLDQWLISYGYAVENVLWLMKNISTVKWHWCAFRKKVTVAIKWITHLIKQCGYCVAW
jgi:hypothetical protein